MTTSTTTFVRFRNFDEITLGEEVTHEGNLAVLWAANPYGSKNLVVVDMDSTPMPFAIRHGNIPSLAAAKMWLTERAYRRVRMFLANKGLLRDLVFLDQVVP